MALDYKILCPKIESAIDEIEREYRETQGLILTEDDLKCILYKKLTEIPELRRPVRTQDEHILSTNVHAELSWYGEFLHGSRKKHLPARRLEIKPDITILDPEYLSILHGIYEPPLNLPLSNPPYYRPRRLVNLFSGQGRYLSFPNARARRLPRLPSKQFEFAGNAITFELKFARRGINNEMLRLIEDDYKQIRRLFRILDTRGEGNSIFSYLVVFDKYKEDLDVGSFAEFFRVNESGPRHKIIYKSGNVGYRL